MAATATLSGPAGVKRVPMFNLAATTGQGLSILHTFLSHLQPRHPTGALRASSEGGYTPGGAEKDDPVAVGTGGGGLEDVFHGVASVGGGGMSSAGSTAAEIGGVGARGGESDSGAWQEGDALLEAKVKIVHRLLGWEAEDSSKIPSSRNGNVLGELLRYHRKRKILQHSSHVRLIR